MVVIYLSFTVDTQAHRSAAVRHKAPPLTIVNSELTQTWQYVTGQAINFPHKKLGLLHTNKLESVLLIIIFISL